MAALKTQINEWNKVLKQPVDKALFIFSKMKKALTFEQLKENISKLINMSSSTKSENESFCDQVLKNPETLLGKVVHHIWSEGTCDVCYGGKVLDYLHPSYQIVYWKEAEDEEEQEDNIFDLTLVEVVKDIRAGNLEILH